MPITEYCCHNCKIIFEDTTTSISKVKKRMNCPKCGDSVKKMISAGAFKVNGFSEANGYAGSK